MRWSHASPCGGASAGRRVRREAARVQFRRRRAAASTPVAAGRGPCPLHRMLPPLRSGPGHSTTAHSRKQHSRAHHSRTQHSRTQRKACRPEYAPCRETTGSGPLCAESASVPVPLMRLACCNGRLGASNTVANECVVVTSVSERSARDCRNMAADSARPVVLPARMRGMSVTRTCASPSTDSRTVTCPDVSSADTSPSSPSEMRLNAELGRGAVPLAAEAAWPEPADENGNAAAAVCSAASASSPTEPCTHVNASSTCLLYTSPSPRD